LYEQSENLDAKIMCKRVESSFQIMIPLKILLLVWMGADAFIFIAVSISPDWPIAAVLPEFVLRARTLLLPFFVD